MRPTNEKACPSAKVILLILILVLAFPTSALSVSAQAPGAFKPIGNMTAPRGGHTATLLPNGKVLITGGRRDGLTSAELFDPVTATFSSTGEMVIPDGEVLIAGGQLPGGSGAAGTDLYDPATGKFSAAEDMTIGRHSHTATLLPDGTVLIAGGYSVWLWPNPGGSSSAELYVPRVLTPPLVVNDLRFDLTVVTASASYAVNISGSGLIAETFFDVRFTSPGNNASVVLNWQRGPAASHAVPVGTASGNWTINGVRAHQIEADHTGSFVPVSATITVSPSN